MNISYLDLHVSLKTIKFYKAFHLQDMLKSTYRTVKISITIMRVMSKNVSLSFSPHQNVISSKTPSLNIFKLNFQSFLEKKCKHFLGKGDTTLNIQDLNIL